MTDSLDYGESLAKLLASPTVARKEWLDDEVGAKLRSFKDKGDIIILLGEINELGGGGSLEKVNATCQNAIDEGILKSANECSQGGLAVTLAESCMIGGLGARVNVEADFATDVLLFGETNSRIIVSMKREKVEAFAALANKNNVPTTVLGMVDEETLDILVNDSIVSVPVGLLEKIWRRSIECAKQ